MNAETVIKAHLSPAAKACRYQFSPLIWVNQSHSKAKSIIPKMRGMTELSRLKHMELKCSWWFQLHNKPKSVSLTRCLIWSANYKRESKVKHWTNFCWYKNDDHLESLKCFSGMYLKYMYCMIWSDLIYSCLYVKLLRVMCYQSCWMCLF